MKHCVLLFAIVLTVALAGSPARAHDVKDPVCRMMVDSDTAKYTYKLGNKTFYFCSQRCETSFARTPEKYVALAAQLEKQDLHEYTVSLETTPAEPVAGQPVEMTIAIRYADTKQLVREFETIHERWLHLLMVSEDLSWFEHQHPAHGEDGLFRLTWRFPRPGRYRLYADFTPSDGDNKEEDGGGDELQFPSLGLKRSLKGARKTVVSFTPQRAGTIPFSCGMSMYRGEVVVK